jgi:hypothetical protein
MTEAGAAVAAAAIAAAAALVGVIASNAAALRNETRRRRAAVADAERQAIRSQAAEVFVHMFHMQHEMEWLTWHAVNCPERVDRSLGSAYENAIHAIYPRILGAMAVLASLDVVLYRKLRPVLDDMYDVDEKIGKEVCHVAQPERHVAAVARLADQHEAARAFYRDLPEKLAEFMLQADS